MANLGTSNNVTVVQIHKAAAPSVGICFNRSKSNGDGDEKSHTLPITKPNLGKVFFFLSWLSELFNTALTACDYESFPSLKLINSSDSFSQLQPKLMKELDIVTENSTGEVVFPASRLLGSVIRLVQRLQDDFSDTESKKLVGLVVDSVLTETLLVSSCLECTKIGIMTAIEMGWKGKAEIVKLLSNKTYTKQDLRTSVHAINVFTTTTSESYVDDLWSEELYQVINAEEKILEAANKHTKDLQDEEDMLLRQ